jgi:peptidoglycan-associated lipoprotein
MTTSLAWTRAALTLALTAALAACSTVDLGEGTGADGASSATPSAGTGASGTSGVNGANGVDGTGVAGVNLGASAADDAAAADLVNVLYFDFDSYALRDEYAPAIASHANRLGQDRARRLTLSGHTDESGSREYNLSLGQQRAEAVRRALVLLGAQDNQVEAISYGEEKPASLGGDEASRALNRRVDISYR